MRNFIRFYTFLIFLLPFVCFSQSSIEKSANDYYSKGNFPKAIEYFEKLIQSDPENHEYLFKMGVSYLSCNVDKTKAVKYLEKLYNIDSKSQDIWYYLALAYHHSLKIDKSLALFKKYEPHATEERKNLVEQHIRNCKSAKKLIGERINVTFTNLGPLVNSKYPDYYPFVSKDDSYLAFTARRRNTTGGYMYPDGVYSSDIMVTVKDTSGNFVKARKGGSRLNSENDDQCVGLSDDGHTMFVYTNENKDGNIYMSYRKTKSFGVPEKLGENVNSKNLESAASISEDESVLFFSSKRENGYGGLDIYMTRKLPNGEWALPQNLGPKINTKFDEDFPTLSADGNTLYFCSEGHQNMGGFDIFSSEWDSENNKWFSPKNIGYPINTPDDERVISFTENKNFAYISAVKKGGLGDLDIYKITLHDNLPQAIVKLTITDGNGNDIPDAFVSLFDQYDDIVGEYMSNPSSNTYILIVPVGKFYLHIEAEGMQYFVHEFNFTIKDLTNPMVSMKIPLTKVK